MAENNPSHKTTPRHIETRIKDSYYTSDNKVVKRVEINPSGRQIDAFGRIRTCNPTTIFNSQAVYDRDLTQFYEKVTSDGTLIHLPNESAVQMTISTTSGSESIRQSKRYHRYHPGKSQLIIMTYSFGTSLEFSKKCVGYYDNDNGVFLINKNGSLFIVLRSKVSGNVVDTEIAQADWNIDTFDGTGESGVTLDAEKMNILHIELSWLGSGKVEVGFIIDKTLYNAHSFNNSNVKTTTYMTTADLPVRYQIVSSGTNTAGDSMRAICSMVATEGGEKIDFGEEFSTPNETEINIDSSKWQPVISIRPKATFRGKVNREEIDNILYRIHTRTNDCFFRVTLDSELTAASWTSVDDDSGIEFDATATTMSGGKLKDLELLAAGESFKVSGAGGEAILDITPLTLDIDGNNPSVLTISAKSRTSSADVVGNFRWKEVK